MLIDLFKESIAAKFPIFFFGKDIQLMTRSESRYRWIIELGVTIQLEHQGRCLSCESVMD